MYGAQIVWDLLHCCRHLHVRILHLVLPFPCPRCLSRAASALIQDTVICQREHNKIQPCQSICPPIWKWISPGEE